MANLKIKSALKNGLSPVYCVGETLEEREAGAMKDVITAQISEALEGVPGTKLEKIIIAYEPVWAVGSDVVPTGNEVMEARILIKRILAEKYGMKNAEKVRILYGGSVKAKYVWQLCVEPGMNGVLVGRESLVPAELIKIAELINNA
jgi:triosephosphate isomerase